MLFRFACFVIRSLLGKVTDTANRTLLLKLIKNYLFKYCNEKETIGKKTFELNLNCLIKQKKMRLHASSLLLNFQCQENLGDFSLS